MGPPVARSAANPWAPGLANNERSRTAGVEPITARVWTKLVSCKSLSECCEARAGAEPGLMVGWCLGLENSGKGDPVRVEPTAARGLPKLLSSKSLTECCEDPK